MVAGAHAQASWIEKFIGWSQDGTFYAITEAGTGGEETPALCLSRRDDEPKTWPNDMALPGADDEDGCSRDYQ